MATPYNSNYVGGEGPTPCRVMLIGEGPGDDENRQGRPFVGKSGVELWRYLWRGCHLTRDDVYVTNIVKYQVPGNDDPTEEDIQRDGNELASELESVNPDFVLCLGRFATRNYLGEVDMDCVHGVTHYRNGRAVVPIIHPAAGLHNTEFQAKIAWDFERAGEALRGRATLVEQQDKFPNPDYCEAPSYFCLALAAVDTEGSAARPWCLSATGHEGAGTVVRKRGAATFKHIILHNSLHDLGVLDALDVEFETFDDTMVMAYELGIEPQGLKSLARRHCGMEMDDYADIVRDANFAHAVLYLDKVTKWLNKQSNNGSTVSSPTSTKSRKRPTYASGGKGSLTTASRKKS